MTKRNPESLAMELARLQSLDRDKLTLEWKRFNKSPPPYRMSHALMLQALAYQLQEAVFGSLTKSVREQLYRIAQIPDGGGAVPTPRITPGTRLLREWHGVTHGVRIEEDGVQYRGQRYRSLSEVASVITGTKWSGPVFFGLKKRKA